MLKLRIFLVQVLSVLVATTYLVAETPTWADGPPTQLHQQLHKIDYMPAQIGSIILGQPLVQVRLNNTINATFLVDTGANNSLINSELAKRLGLLLHPALGVEWKGHDGQVMVTDVTSFEVDNVIVNNAPFLVLDAKSFHPFQGASSEGRCDGVIGANVLEKSAIYLDCPQHKFGFCLPGALSPEQLSQAGFPSPYVLPLTINADTNQWFVHAEMNNEVSNGENLLLDTGTNTTVISDHLAQAVHLKPTGQVKRDDFYGSNVVSISRIDALQLGSLTLQDFPVIVQSGSTNQLSSLGMDILSGYRVLMDFPAKKMYLQPNPSVVPAITIGSAPAATAPTAK